jgi:S-adenosylmethionine hydrolase
MIVLFTDFGLEGPYTGQVKAVLYQTAPTVPVIELFADAPAGRPKPAAYLLAAYGDWFPPGTVLLAVIDPGVGSTRAPIIVEAAGRWYVGPDNGLLELVLRRAGSARTWEILWRPQTLSASFHGRDLFAPVAGRLARGEHPDHEPRAPEIGRHGDWPDDLPEIVYVDRYGNAMTGLRGDLLPREARLAVSGRVLKHARTFSDVPAGEAFWYENSNGLAEIAVNAGRAADALRLVIGSPVAVLR